MVMKKGSIIWVDFNPTKGHEQAGRRPALVISNEPFNRLTGLLVVLPISNTKRKYPLYVPIESGKTSGVVMCDQIRTIDPEVRNVKFIEMLAEKEMAKVHGFIDSVIG